MHEPLRYITTFGLGHRRPASGTWGSLPPVAVALLFILIDAGPATQPAIFRAVMGAITIFFAWACIAEGDRAELRWGKDPGEAVADETSGQALVLALLPAATTTTISHATLATLVAFIAFRLADIIKPWPANAIQRLPAGWGILLDDLIAALYTAGVLWLLRLWLF